jgi:hypothetical protein
MYRKQKAGALEYPSDTPYTYLSEGRSELATHWTNPALPARGGSRKQKAGNMVESVGTNFVSNKDMFGCPQKGGKRSLASKKKGVSFSKQIAQVKLFQKGGKILVDKQEQRDEREKKEKVSKQKGGDCGCAGQPMMLGGASKNQKGAGFGYNMDVARAITNKPEVVRYSTDVMTGGRRKKASTRASVSKKACSKKASVKKTSPKKQKAGSMASDSLMKHFMDFQHRCRSTEIY